jgi:hypothetical protein
MMTVKIVPNETANKLADAELHFTMPDPATFHASLRPTFEALAGLKLIGFSIWEYAGRRNVTFPARTYSVNGERRSFALLRPTSDPSDSKGIRDLILREYAHFEAKSLKTTA